MKTVLHEIGRWLAILIGALLMILGFLTFWLPIPIGLPLLIIGMALLVRYSPTARATFMPMARRWPWFGRLLRRVTMKRHRADVERRLEGSTQSREEFDASNSK